MGWEWTPEYYKGLDAYADKIAWAFERDPVQAGYHHATEYLLLDALNFHGREAWDAWIVALMGASYFQRYLGDTVLCLGRVMESVDDPHTWKVWEHVGELLKSKNVMILDAAIKFFEQVGTQSKETCRAAIDILERHPLDYKEGHWCGSYRKRVIEYLKERLNDEKTAR